MEKAAAAEQTLKDHTASSNLPPVADTPFPPLEEASTNHLHLKADKGKERRTTFSALEKPTTAASGTTSHTNAGSVRRRRRATTKGSRRGFHGTEELLTKEEAEELCHMIQGHLVQFPYDWLLVEEGNGNWLYQVDQVAPLQI